LLFPSYREGFPNVVLQAGAMGLPSIVTDINGCNEIIVNEKNGLIIPVKNSHSIQKSIEKICLESDLFENLKKNTRSMVQLRYEQKIIWNAILEEYIRLIKEKNLN
jgi:glycosyltransferase involved in cell wall biosynthesis